jgi:hypothetical protein
MYRILVGALCVIILALCSACVIKISEIKGNPGQYTGQTIELAVRIDEKESIPLLNAGIYKISDSSGRAILASCKDYKEKSAANPRGTAIAFDGKSAAKDMDRINANLKRWLVREKLATKDNQAMLDLLSRSIVQFCRQIGETVIILDMK